VNLSIRFLADLTNEADRAHRVVLRKVVGNGLEIALDENLKVQRALFDRTCCVRHCLVSSLKSIENIFNRHTRLLDRLLPHVAELLDSLVPQVSFLRPVSESVPDNFAA
jgi:hypothetical protein